jgi:hypothetical protein
VRVCLYICEVVFCACVMMYFYWYEDVIACMSVSACLYMWVCVFMRVPGCCLCHGMFVHVLGYVCICVMMCLYVYDSMLASVMVCLYIC